MQSVVSFAKFEITYDIAKLKFIGIAFEPKTHVPGTELVSQACACQIQLESNELHINKKKNDFR